MTTKTMTTNAESSTDFNYTLYRGISRELFPSLRMFYEDDKHFTSNLKMETISLGINLSMLKEQVNSRTET